MSKVKNPKRKDSRLAPAMGPAPAQGFAVQKTPKDPQGRKWQITINNAEESGFTHEKIKTILENFKSIIYWAMCDEVGEKETPHTHLYIDCSSCVRFSTLKNFFPTAHLERANGTAQENRDYLTKTGRWEGTGKAETSVCNSFDEWGKLPQERQGGRNLESAIINRILDGASNSEILLEFDYLNGLRDVEYARQVIREEEFRSKNRDVQVTYVSGPTNVGKSHNLMKENAGDTYRITDYNHPWDFYAGQSTIVMEEFASSLKIGEILNVLDIYPLTLRARYANKIAMFDKVFIVSNIELFDQYHNIQLEQPEVFRAFLRRIHKVVVYTAYQQFNTYSLEEYKTISRGYRFAEARLEYRGTTYRDYLNSEVPIIETDYNKQSKKHNQPGLPIQQAIPRIGFPEEVENL